MAGFLYYLPKLKGARGDDLARAGLLSTVGSAIAMGEAQRGPDGGNGCLVVRTTSVDGAEQPQLGFDASAQVWHPCDKSRWWLGWWKSSSPRPVDLERAGPSLTCHRVVLRDGATWRVPVARHFPEGSPLPKALVLGPDGQSVTEEVLPEFVEFSRRAEQLWNWFCGANGLDLATADPGDLPDDLWRIETAGMALGLVYHVSKWELSALRLTDTQGLKLIEQAVFDWPFWERFTEVAKKKHPRIFETLRSGAGSEAASPATPPPSERSSRP